MFSYIVSVPVDDVVPHPLADEDAEGDGGEELQSPHGEHTPAAQREQQQEPQRGPSEADIFADTEIDSDPGE